MFSEHAWTEFAMLAGKACAAAVISIMAFIFDLVPWRAVKLVLFAAILENQTHGPPRTSVTVPLCIAGVIFLLTTFFSLNIFFTFFMAVVKMDNFLLATLDIYCLYDGPTNRIATEWRIHSTRIFAYLATSSLLNYGRQIFYHSIGHWRDVDGCSLLFLFFILLAVLPWPWWTTPGNVATRLFELHDVLQVYDGKLVHYKIQFSHNLRRGLRAHAEKLHAKRIMLDTVPDFVHAPLEPGQIRLLRLSRRSIVSGLIEAHLIHVPLNSAPPYEALSYVWGDPKPGLWILLEGRKFLVAPNLYSLLHARSNFVKDRLIWVDAICIDQENNTTEKQAQIRLMGDIYEKASRVVAWLGDPPEASLAAKTIIDVHATIHMFDFSPIDLFNNFRWQTESPQWKAFIKIIRSPYITRAWICQEAILADRLEFYVGGYYISWMTLSTAILGLSAPENESLLLGNSSLDFNSENWAFVNILRLTGTHTSIPLGLLLFMFARLRATNERDQVYALLGLAETDTARAIAVDYTQPYQRVYTDIATILLKRREDCVYILPHAGVGYPGVSSQLPSWVPDWHATSTRNCGVLSAHFPESVQTMADLSPDPDTINPGNFRYNATNSSSADFTLCECNDALYTPAVQVERISSLSDLFHGLVRDPAYHRAWLSSTLELAFGIDETVSDYPVPDAFWRTLIGDRSIDEFPAPGYFANFFQIWREYVRRGDSMASDPTLGERLMELAAPTGISDGYALFAAGRLFVRQTVAAASGRRFAVTESGAFALVPPRTRVGDELWLIKGLQTPYVLRACPATDVPVRPCVHDIAVQARLLGRYQLVGECYAHGWMDGTRIDMDRADVGVVKLV